MVGQWDSEGPSSLMHPTRQLRCDANAGREISPVKTRMQLKTIGILPGAVCALFLCVGSVAAQMDPGSGTKIARPNDTKPAATQPTPKPANQKPVAADASNSPSPKAANAQPTEPTDNSQPAPAVPKDPIIVILEQIAAAPTAQDVATLRLKLVDELVRRGDKQEA